MDKYCAQEPSRCCLLVSIILGLCFEFLCQRRFSTQKKKQETRAHFHVGETEKRSPNTSLSLCLHYYPLSHH